MVLVLVLLPFVLVTVLLQDCLLHERLFIERQRIRVHHVIWIEIGRGFFLMIEKNAFGIHFSIGT